MSSDRFTFFKQSGWLVIATGICGVFLIGVYPVVTGMPTTELGIFVSLLRLFTILGIATSGLQIVMAQDAAAAISPEQTRTLRRTAAAVFRGIFLVWFAILFVGAWGQPWLVGRLKITNPAALWVTFGLVLAQLFLPFAQGLLQGTQNFAWYGWSIMLNGVGRFAAMIIAVLLLHGTSTAALAAALLGLAAAVLVALWPSRGLLKGCSEPFNWGAWLKRVVPLSGGIGSSVFLMNADVLFVQSLIREQDSPFYSAVAMVGVGLVTFTTPMAAVMFPKLVRSVARSQGDNSLALALFGTAVLGLMGALVCTAWPWLP
ncbi:MAG TPA: hypothetical protein VK633_07645, partial [Verrucomicrobiae bacterium]|nr:hypothetical protein [Verrucomicrobiae bacterium]